MIKGGNTKNFVNSRFFDVHRQVYDQNFYGGKGWWMGRGVPVKDAWARWVKAKVAHRGEGVLKLPPPLPPFNLKF